MANTFIVIGSMVDSFLTIGGLAMAIIKWILCVISYAMLASLDGLMQLHCNGNVTKAHGRLEKHLNKQAHGQHRNGNS